MPKSSKPPAYRRHKSSGQAVVTFNRRDVYLGTYGSAESKELYFKILAGIVKPEELVRWPTAILSAAVIGITVIELLAAF